VDWRVCANSGPGGVEAPPREERIELIAPGGSERAAAVNSSLSRAPLARAANSNRSIIKIYCLFRSANLARRIPRPRVKPLCASSCVRGGNRRTRESRGINFLSECAPCSLHCLCKKSKILLYVRVKPRHACVSLSLSLYLTMRIGRLLARATYVSWA
jgi:hypothetical protein